MNALIAHLPARALFIAHLAFAAPFAATFSASPALAQDAGAYEPKSGQPGKDVVWVPTPQALVDRMLDIAEAKSGERLMDLGSGDGRTVITAAQRGLTAEGIEYNPDLVVLARRNAEAAGVTERATFREADLFETDLSSADVITLFLLSSINVKLRPTILELKPGTRIVSNTFDMGDWEPDETSDAVDACTSWCRALLWIVPAKVEGRWQIGDQELRLEQRYQMLSGTFGSAEISDARLKGTEISFTANGTRYTGTVSEGRIEGKDSKSGAWTAQRI